MAANEIMEIPSTAVDGRRAMVVFFDQPLIYGTFIHKQVNDGGCLEGDGWTWNGLQGVGAKRG